MTRRKLQEEPNGEPMNMENAAKLKTQEAARARVYRSLADAYRDPESNQSPLLEEIEASLAQLCSDARGAAVRLKASYRAMPDTRPLAVDHAALFLGPFLVPAPPYGSVYLEDGRQLMGASTVDVRRHYRSLGFDLAAEFKAAPDHISAELEFMQILISGSLAAIDAEDYGLLSESINHQRVFLQNHLGAWIPAFSDKMIQHAQTDYHRNLAAVTRAFITEEIEALPDLPLEPAAEALPTA
jgi:TorA maturation chaperone TorD